MWPGCVTLTAFSTMSLATSVRRISRLSTSAKSSDSPIQLNSYLLRPQSKTCLATRRMRCWRLPRSSRIIVSVFDMRWWVVWHRSSLTVCLSTGAAVIFEISLAHFLDRAPLRSYTEVKCCLSCRGLLHRARKPERWGRVYRQTLACCAFTEEPWGQIWLQN